MTTTPGTPTSHGNVRAAKRAARARKAHQAGRALPVKRDTELVETKISDRLVDDVCAMIDHDPTLTAWIETLIVANYVRPGRPREFSIRTALVLFAIGVIVNRNFLHADLEALIDGISARKRAELGIDYRRHGQLKQISYTQLLDVFHSIARTMDAWDPKLAGLANETTIREQRAGRLQTFVERLVAASAHTAGQASGDYAADATMKWSWERPPHSGGKKIGRRGHDGDAGRPARLEDVMDGAEFQPPDPVSVVRRTEPKPNWPATWSLGAEWAGRPNNTKAVHGYAFHSMVRCGENEPALIDTFIVTPAAAHPAQALVPAIRRLEHRRRHASLPAGTPPLGNVIADPGYSAAAVDDWQLPLAQLGARPVFRLHRTNQEPPRWIRVGKGAAAGDVLFIGGRPMCECAADHPAAEARFPKWPYTTADLEKYQHDTAALLAFQWRPNGASRVDGSRQFLTPHTNGPDGNPGGCERCVDHTGAAVTRADGSTIRRCCQKRSRRFTQRQLAMYQDHTVGQPAWIKVWSRRNIVEGSYGIMKHRSILDWGHDFHHFVGLARETIAAAFAAIAYNFHMQRSWAARQKLCEPDDDDPFAGRHLSAAMPAVADPSGHEPAAGRGPAGLEFLGAGPPG